MINSETQVILKWSVKDSKKVWWFIGMATDAGNLKFRVVETPEGLLWSRDGL